jgi:hypothetical protein
MPWQFAGTYPSRFLYLTFYQKQLMDSNEAIKHSLRNLEQDTFLLLAQVAHLEDMIELTTIEIDSLITDVQATIHRYGITP